MFMVSYHVTMTYAARGSVEMEVWETEGPQRGTSALQMAAW